MSCNTYLQQASKLVVQHTSATGLKACTTHICNRPQSLYNTHLQQASKLVQHTSATGLKACTTHICNRPQSLSCNTYLQQASKRVVQHTSATGLLCNTFAPANSSRKLGYATLTRLFHNYNCIRLAVVYPSPPPPHPHLYLITVSVAAPPQTTSSSRQHPSAGSLPAGALGNFQSSWDSSSPPARRLLIGAGIW